MNSYILSTWEIFYPNSGIKQIKNLITYETFGKSKTMDEKERKKYLKQFEPYFTIDSPLHEAMSTGMLVTPFTNEPVEFNLV